MPDRRSFDAVIVGGGHNALVAADDHRIEAAPVGHATNVLTPVASGGEAPAAKTPRLVEKHTLWGRFLDQARFD